MRALSSWLFVLAAVLAGCTQTQQAAPPGAAATPAAAAATPAQPAPASTAAAPAAAVSLTEVVPDLPDFPNAVAVANKEKGASSHWTKTRKREIRVAAPFAEVQKFYLEQIARKGWTVAQSKEKLGKVEWGLSKGTSWAEIEIDGRSPGYVEVSLERKDR